MHARFVLIRHGHTASNGGSPSPVMSGWADLPLTATGRSQAAALAASGAAGPLDAVYSSPLARARDTAAVLAAPHQPVRYLDDLRELACGEVDGLAIEAVRRAYPDVWARNAAEEDDDFRWPGGESYAELRRRAVATLATLAARHRGERVAVVTHAGVITQLVGHLRGVAPARWSVFRVGNASLTELAWSGDTGEVVSLDRRDHLPRPLRT